MYKTAFLVRRLRACFSLQMSITGRNELVDALSSSSYPPDHRRRPLHDASTLSRSRSSKSLHLPCGREAVVGMESGIGGGDPTRQSRTLIEPSLYLQEPFVGAADEPGGQLGEPNSEGLYYSDHGGRQVIHRCRLCPYFTPRRSDMKNHVRTHTREKPFWCRICYYRTNFKSDLLKHERLRHPLQERRT